MGEQVTAATAIERWLSVEEFVLRTARHQTSYSLVAGDGLLRAFNDPPYGLGSASPDEVGRWWVAITAELFNSFGGDLEIARWSNDWSTFFASGHEWWGAFWWTVVNRERGWVVVVAASSGD